MNTLGRYLTVGEAILMDPAAFRSGLTEYELVAICTAPCFGGNPRLIGTCVMVEWADSTDPGGVRVEGLDILCSCRAEQFRCPGCGTEGTRYIKQGDGRRMGQAEAPVSGQACAGCGAPLVETMPHA